MTPFSMNGECLIGIVFPNIDLTAKNLGLKDCVVGTGSGHKLFLDAIESNHNLEIAVGEFFLGSLP